MFWVFCNSCFIRPNQGNNRNFYMTSCSHIFCDRCIRPGDSICKRCQANCVIVQCNSEMPDEVKELFTNTNDNPSNLIRALEFQEFHRKRLMLHYKLVIQKYNHSKMVVNELQQNLTILEKKYEMAKQTLRSREEVIATLSRKLQMYQSNSDTLLTPLGTPKQGPLKGHTSNLNFTQLNPVQKTSINQQNMPLKFTPRNNFTNYRKTSTPALTPKSVGSNKSSIASSGLSAPRSGNASTGEKRRLIPGFTPPTNPLALLSLLNNRPK